MFVHTYNINGSYGMHEVQRLSLEIPVLVQSLKSNNVELGQYLDGTLFKCCLIAAANP